MSVEGIASALLGVDSFGALAQANLNRCLLAGGRFEAGRFGLQQHSSASAGAVMNGVASLPLISDSQRRAVAAAGFDLLTDTGMLRGHDSEPSDGITSWSLSQVLLGVLRLSGAEVLDSARFTAGLQRLLAYQSGDGRWSLRKDDLWDTSFSFYPMLLMARLLAAKVKRDGQLEVSVQRSFDPLVEIRADIVAPATDRLLAHAVLNQRAVKATVSSEQRRALRSGQGQFFASLLDATGRTTLADKSIQNDLQPRWHSVTWSPLLYLCTRQLAPPTQSLNVQLAARLIQSFDNEDQSWRAPSHQSGVGSSWATSLALRAVYQLATDLAAAGVSAEHYRSRLLEESVTDQFDVVISFGGRDRKVAQKIRNRLVAAGLRVFFDTDFQHRLLGEDLGVLLQDIYFARSRYAVVVLSQGFLDSDWAGNWEWRAVLARMQKERSGYVLPYFLEDVAVPGLNPTIGYIDARKYTPKQFADVVIAKLREAPL